MQDQVQGCAAEDEHAERVVVVELIAHRSAIEVECDTIGEGDDGSHAEPAPTARTHQTAFVALTMAAIDPLPTRGNAHFIARATARAS